MKELYPLFMGNIERVKKGLILSIPGKKITTDMPFQFVNELRKLSDGTKKESEIIKKLTLEWNQKGIARAIDYLRQEGVIIDSRNISEFIWKFIENPTIWWNEPNAETIRELLSKNNALQKSEHFRFNVEVSTPLGKTIANRKSTRSFEFKKLEEKDLSYVLWAGFGKMDEKIGAQGISFHRRTVPSAGALYTTKLYVCLFASVGRMAAGIYEVDFPEPNVVSYRKTNDVRGEFASCFINPHVLCNSLGVIVILSDTERSSLKYANRGISYSLMEAGNVLGNMLLATGEKGMNTLCVGGFSEKKIAESLGCKKTDIPVVTLVFDGTTPYKTSQKPKTVMDKRFVSFVTEEDDGVTGGYQIPFKMVFAKPFDDETGDWACGRAKNLETAYAIALSEAIEWNSIKPNNDIHKGSFLNMKEMALDPERMARYAKGQFMGKNAFFPFIKNDEYEWTPIKHVENGKQKMILADFAFFPHEPEAGKRYFRANSSGCAAHLSIERALTASFLEIIERDAFMTSWILGHNEGHYDESCLSREMQKDIRALKECGISVNVFKLCDLPYPVVLVTAIHDEDEFFTCASACSPDPMEAIAKAMREIQSSVYSWMKLGTIQPKIEKQSVISVADHSDFYRQKKYVRRAKNFFGAKNAPEIKKIKPWKGEELTLERMIIRLKQEGAEPYYKEYEVPEELDINPKRHVVKAFIPGFVPLTFGFHSEPILLDRIREKALSLGRIGKQARIIIPPFPHPFN